MAGVLSRALFGATATAMLLSAGLPTVACAADSEVLFPGPRMASYLANNSNTTLVGYNRPNCCNGCPGDSNSAIPRPGDGTAPSADGVAASGADLQPEQFAGLASDTWSVNDAPGGYIDNPIVATWFRLRYDDAFNDPRPDRAEFFYAKYGTIGGPGPSSPTGFSPSKVNFQSVSPYMEVLLAPRLSVFAELPVQRTDMTFPDPGNPSTVVKNGGLADMNAGFKYALVVCPDRYLTFQFKTYAPTGDASRGLGNNHVSLEPGLLFLRRLSPRSYFQGELRYWIPINGTDFAGNVIRYGGGIGYDLINTSGGAGPLNPYTAQGYRVTAVTEFVGWTVIGGKSTKPDAQGAATDIVESANGDTIVNLKVGVRVSHGLGSVYAGWGHALTEDKWYQDLFRLEYRRMF